MHQPDHFPLAENLIPYRDQIGKRPPLASMELIWTCHQGSHLHISGYVHSPTEERHWKTLELMGEQNIITIKGLEGGTDLSISRSSTIGQYKNQMELEQFFIPKTMNIQDKILNGMTSKNGRDLRCKLLMARVL